MHELAIAQGLVAESERVARRHRAAAIELIVAQVGALSGVEPGLLERAFTVARSGSLAAKAVLRIEITPIEVACRACGGRGTAMPSRLLCPDCGGWQVEVVAGEELVLASVELSGVPGDSASPGVERAGP